MEFLRNHALAVSLSTLLHVVLALALTVGLDLPARQRARAPVEQVAIQATVVDERLIQQEMERLEALEQAELRAQQERADEARRQREEEERRLEAARVQREEVERQEEARLAEVQSLRESEERAAREAEAARLEAEQQRREEEERIARLREEEQRQQREEEERRRVAAEAARRQAESEAELARAMAAEEEARRAEEARLLDEYIRLIENRIQQNWIPPASAQVGLECTVYVTQIPGGDVVDVRVGQCNGDEAVVRSIEVAVRSASPLPRPPIPSLFDRNLEVIFRPEV